MKPQGREPRIGARPCRVDTIESMGARRYKSHPQSAPGDFYVVNDECVACGVPHVIAPELIGWAENVNYSHCVWKRQPETEKEIEDAIGAVLASEVACHRYAGDDLQIINRLGWDYCDSKLRTVPGPAVELQPPSPPTFGLIASGPSLLDRIVALLKAAFRK